MKRLLARIRRFYASLGLVEQSQIVASTSVVVAMVTIVTANIVIGHTLEWMDFISILTVGIFGFITVFFSLKYGRQLEEQRRELVALNTIAEAVNHSVELNYVLHSSLLKVMELMRADCGWLYIVEHNSLILRHQYGTSVKFFKPDCLITEPSMSWIRESNLYQIDNPEIRTNLTSDVMNEGMAILASIPLERQGILAGVLVITSKEEKKFESKKIALIQAFGNQISVALQNASLYEQVRQSERLYADLYEYSPDMYHSVDSKGIVVSCNLTESRMLGMQKEDIVGRPLLKLYPASQHEHIRNNLQKIFQQGDELRGIEEQLQRKDGTLIDVSVSASIVYDGGGKPTLARMVLRDITEKKKMEAKIFQAQKIDSIGSLAGGVAHDFNNILTSVLGSASIMRRKVSHEQRLMKYVELIETASRRGAALTRQLLTFARKNNPHVRLVDMNTILDETIRLFTATSSRSIHIKTILSEEPVIVEADEGQIQQAVLNLCLNARDAMPNGGVLVIQCRTLFINEHQAMELTGGKAGDYVVVSVADSGMGIPTEILNRIFEPFFTTKEQGKGTGLGLSVVYGVVHQHNGHIHVESEIDSGTVFTMYLPRILHGKLTSSSKPVVTELVGGKESILLIEDEISVGEIGADILAELGYSVDVVHNGRDAMQTLMEGKKQFSLVILDMNMPRMGGRATFEHIRERFPHLKILVCSGYSAVMLDDGKFVQAIDGFIQKPYELADLAQKIRFVLDSQSVSQPLTR